MHNKKIVAKGLVFTTTLVNVPMDSLANTIEESKTINTEDNTKENKGESGIKKFFAKIVEPIEEFMYEPKEVIKLNKNIVRGSVLQINLGDDDFVQDLTGNPGGYETVRVTTTGSKKLVEQDYDNLRLSGISKIDLSNAYSDSISRGAFVSASHLTEFQFPQGITSIGRGAFNGCSGLTGDLVIPEGVERIEDYAFYNCSGLDGNLIIPNSVISIGQDAFNGCSGLTGNLIIPNSVTSIGSAAFKYCSGFDGNLVISEGVESIEGYAFYNCSGFDGNLMIPNLVTSIGNNAFDGCSGFDGNLIIGNAVTSIGNNAFYNCSGFKGNLVIPSSVINIDNYAFRNCSGITGNLVIPEGVESIGSGAFNGCKGFDGKLIIPNSVTSIGSSAFNRCSGLTGDLVIPEGVENIEDYAFYNCSGLTGNLIIPNSVTSIGQDAFNGCSGLTGNLIIPNSVTSIGSAAFKYCSGFDGNLVIPSSVTSISNNAFNGCSGIEKIIIKVDSSDIDTNYKESIIANLPNNTQTIIDLPYNFNIIGTWLETTNKTIGKPIIKNVVDGIESNLVNNKGEAISLYIPSVYQETNIQVLKDDKNYSLPTKNSDGKHIFAENGVYEVTITTDLGNTSIITFEVEDAHLRDAKEAVSIAEVSKSAADIKNARDLVNSLSESLIKDQLQDRLNTIFPNITLEKKTATANLDVYIKSENMLSLSLDTNSVTFEEYSGAEPIEKLGAVNLTVNSSLPYNLNAYMSTEISNTDGSEKMPIDILNIRESNEGIYKQFENTSDKVVLKENCQKGNDVNHSIDLKLDSNDAHVADIYKTVIKFEAEQK